MKRVRLRGTKGEEERVPEDEDQEEEEDEVLVQEKHRSARDEVEEQSKNHKRNFVFRWSVCVVM